MTAPIRTEKSRFWLESHNHDGSFIAALPYQNLQGEWLLNEKGSQLRGQIPFRGYKEVTLANFYPGKHEIWLYDRKVSTSNPIFAGPVWDATASSSSGVISFSAQCPLSYLTKRLLKASKTYNTQQPVAMMANLITYVNSIRATNIVTSTSSANAQTASAFYKATDQSSIAELFQTISEMADGVDYYCRTSGTTHTIYLHGGRLKPSAQSRALSYGGGLDGYSLQLVAQSIGNEVNIINNVGTLGLASSAANQTAYDALYQIVEKGSDLKSSTQLNNAASTRLKDKSATKLVPTIVTRILTPIKDFDFGSQFTIAVNDDYAQYNDLVRAVGWQLTINQGDDITVNIYTNDTSEVV